MKHHLQVIMDIGASNIRTSISAADAMPPILTRPTPSTYEGLLQAVAEEVATIASHQCDAVSALFVACPGLVNLNGYVELALYIPLSGADLRSDLEARVGVPVTVVNDSKAQASGCTISDESLIYFSLGTAVGGAIVDRGRVVLGARGYAGEFGHLPIKDGNLKCPCGRRGCLDTMASGWSLQATLGQNWWHKPTPEARLLVRRAGLAVGYVARLLTWLADPARVVVAGKLASYPEFQQDCAESFSEYAQQIPLEFTGDTWQFARRGLELIAARSSSWGIK